MGQNLGQVMSIVEKKVKKQVISLGFFSYFTWEYLLKQEAVVVKPPEWKFMAIITRNAKILRMLGPIFCPIWMKNRKKTDNSQ